MRGGFASSSSSGGMFPNRPSVQSFGTGAGVDIHISQPGFNGPQSNSRGVFGGGQVQGAGALNYGDMQHGNRSNFQGTNYQGYR